MTAVFRIMLAAVFALGATSAAAAMQNGPTLYGPADAQILELAAPFATVSDDAGTPLFEGDREFILGFAKNPRGVVYSWDQPGQRIRINASGAAGAWLACSSVRPMSEACKGQAQAGVAPPMRRRPPASRGPAAAQPASALPMCPGDARCPRL
jgi:hypothetical protein